MRKICDLIANDKSAGKTMLEAMLPGTFSDALVRVCRAFTTLQEARHAADYDLAVAPSLAGAKALRTICLSALSDWNEVRETPEATVLLTALLLSDKWTRRG